MAKQHNTTDNRRKLYDVLQEHVGNMGTWEEFDRRMNDEDNRRKVYEVAQQRVSNIGTWDEFNDRVYQAPAAPAASRPQAQVTTQPAATAHQATVKQQPSSTSPKTTQYFKLRRGGKDFMVSTDEVNAAGGLAGWANAHPGAPVRVYMQGKKEDGSDFNGHVDLSVAHDRRKHRGYKYSTVSKTVHNKPWRPTKQEKAAMSLQLQMQMDEGNARLQMQDEAFQRRMEGIKKGNKPGAFMGEREFNPQTGKTQTNYYTTHGDRVATPLQQSKVNKDNDNSIESQLERAYKERDELNKKANALLAEIDKKSKLDEPSVLSSILSSGDPMTGAMSATSSPQTQARLSDTEYQQYRQAIREVNERIKTLENRRYVNNGGDQGFWRSFGQTVSDVETWTGSSVGYLSANAKMNANVNPHTESAQALLKAEVDKNEVESKYGDFGFWSRAGVMTGEMLPFMVDFMTMNMAGGYTSSLTRGLTALLLKGGHKVASKMVNKALPKFTIKTLGAMPEDLIKSTIMANTIQSGKTAKDIVDRKLGDAVYDEDKDRYEYANDKTWSSAIWQAEANAVIENFSEMFGTHLDGIIPWAKIADAVGAKRISGVLSRANASGYKKMLETSRKQFESLGVSDYFGEVAEEYYGQLWRTMLNLDDAYQINPDGTRTNLLATGRFHGDIWGGMALSMGLMGAGKNVMPAVSYGVMRHKVNKADKNARNVFSIDEWEKLRSEIDGTTNDNIGALAESIISNNTLTTEQRNAAMEYMERSMNLRGLNLANVAIQRGGEEGAPDIEIWEDPDFQQLNSSYMRGMNLSSPEEIEDAFNDFDAKFRDLQSFIDENGETDSRAFIEDLDNDPIGILQGIEDDGLREKVRDYLNAKQFYDGALQNIRNREDLEDEAENKNPIGRAVMKYQDRQVEVLNGRVVMMEDGTMVDNERSDKTIVIRDVATGKVEMVAPEAILSYEEYPAEPFVDNYVDNSMAGTPAEDAPAEEQPKYGSGQITIRNSDGTTTRGWLTGEVDEEGKYEYYVEGDLQHLYYAIEQELDNIVDDFMPDAPKEPEHPIETPAEQTPQQPIADAEAYDRGYNDGIEVSRTISDELLNEAITDMRERDFLSDEWRGRLKAYEYEQQRRQIEGAGNNETEDITDDTPGYGADNWQEELPQRDNKSNNEASRVDRTIDLARNGDSSAIADLSNYGIDPGTPGVYRFAGKGEVDALMSGKHYRGRFGDGRVDVTASDTVTSAAYKDYRIKFKSDFDLYKTGNGRAKMKSAQEKDGYVLDGYDLRDVESIEELQPDGTYKEVYRSEDSVEETLEQTPLQRIPRDEKGEPVFEQAETPELGWNALVEFSEGDAATAKEIADAMTEEKRKAFEKAQKLKAKGKTPTEILASKKANAAELAKAESEYNLWQRMAGIEQSRQDAIRRQQEAETRRLAAERAEAEKVERAAREEAERIEREALEGIPEWHKDTPENARKRGTRRFNGQMFTRQEPVQGVVGNEVEVKFSQKDLPKGSVAVMEASELQPSHIQGQRNPMFFIDEAQPKNRAEVVSTHAARKIAESIRPQEITGSATAYTGAPTVNTRGEVIQGNNRSDALRYLWDNNLPQQQQAYKQYILDNAEQFGLDPEAVNAMSQPVLVNMLDIDDAEAIRLGQMTAQDTESGGIERIKPKNVAQKLGENMRIFANRLLNSGDEEATFGQLVDRNGTDVLKWMSEVGAISATQYQSAFDSKGNLTAEAKNDLQKVLYQAVFKGGSRQLEEMFDKLPAKAQRAILSTAFRDMDSPDAGKMLHEIQASIVAYNELMVDPGFAESRKFEDILRAIEGFKQTFLLDDMFEQYKPSDNFSNLALHLAGMYKASDMSQTTLASYFNQMYDLAQGKKEATLFEEADTTEYPLAEIVKKVLNIEYQPAKNENRNDRIRGASLGNGDKHGQERQRGDGELSASGERTSGGTEPSERGRGAAGDSRGGGIGTRGGESQEATQQKRLSKEEAADIIAKMEMSAVLDPKISLSPESWHKSFGLSNSIDTPLGKVKMGEGQYQKLVDKKRSAEFGMVVQTLQDPDVVFIEPSEAKEGQTAERNFSYVFVKTFIRDGKKFKYYTSVSVLIDGMEVSISSHIASNTAIMKKLQDMERAYTKESLLPNSSEWHLAEHPSDVPDLLPTQGKSEISERKVTNSASDKQTDGAESSVQPSDNKGAQTVQSAVEAASAEVNTEPTPAQVEAGNYKKGHVTIGEFDITIENPAGSVRKGVDADGKEWSTTMANAYGYIKGTEGVDGDHIDVFLHQNMDEWDGRKVFVVDQTNTDGTFDEHKVMLGFNDKDEAMSAYLANYDDTWAQTHPGIRISETDIEDFNKWVQSSHRKTKPFADYSTVSKVTDETPTQTAAAISGTGYKIESKPYTNKQGKTLDTYLVTFDRDFSKEEMSALRAKAKGVKGWYDRESGGWMLRGVDNAKAFAEEIAGKSEDDVADEAPLSMTDMEKSSDSPVKKVDVGSVFDALKTKGAAKLSDHATPVEQPKPKKRRWISEEDADEFDAIHDSLRRHFGKGDNIVKEGTAAYGKPQPKQMDAEVLRMGTRMTYLMMKGGLRSFSDYCEAMKDELPDIFDEMRPHLKSLYAAAQNMEEVMQLGWDEEMDDRKTVKAFDVYNFDKPGAKDIIETAKHVVDETESQKQTQAIIDLLKGKRNEQRRREADKTSADTEAIVSKAETAADEVESKIEAATTERETERLSRSLDKEIEGVNKQLALLGYYEADPVYKDFNEAYGYMRNAERKAVQDAHRLATQLANDLGLTIDPKDKVRKAKYGFGSKIARSNVAPAGGEVYITLPLSGGRVLSIWLRLDKNEPWRERGREDRSDEDLILTGIMYRVENTDSGERYLTSNNDISPTATYDELLSSIRRLVRYYLPEDAEKPATPLAPLPGEDFVDMAKRVAAEHAEKKPVVESDKPMEDLFAGEKLSNTLTAYDELKAKHPDAVVLMKVGDFYITYREDATLISKVLGVTLTRRHNGKDGKVELAGFPAELLNQYLPSLIRSGHRVALGDYQTKSPVISKQEPTTAMTKAEATKRAVEALKGGKDSKLAKPAKKPGQTSEDILVGLFDMAERGESPYIVTPETEAELANQREAEAKTPKSDQDERTDVPAAPAITVPEPRAAADLIGDSAAYQERERQTVELVSEICGVIENRVGMNKTVPEIAKPLTMTDVKKMAAKYPALKDISDTDLQELVELAMTQLTRTEALEKIEGTDEAQRASYDHIVALYNMQPSLNARDSERLIKQQYSTPTPFGFVMGQFVRAGGKAVGSMLEPSAGNGALTITIDPSVVHVNDIDEARLANLRKLGYGQVTAQDALLPFRGEKVDVVMTNPPFGTVTEKIYDGVFRISSLEGQMAINALEQMKDDGRAAIVIGGNTSYRTNGSMNPKDAAFLGYLYSNYNVVDVINISGKALYSRNGTGYDVRMILIDGRKTGEFQRIYPPVKAKARAEQITTFDELYKRVQDDIQQIQQVGNQTADVQRDPGTATDRTESTPIRSGDNRADRGSGQRSGTTGDVLGGSSKSYSRQTSRANVGGRSFGVDNADRGDGTGINDVPRGDGSKSGQQKPDIGLGDGRGRSGDDGRISVASRSDGGTERLAVTAGLTEEKVAYPNQSKNGFTLMSVVPAAQATVLQKSLGEIGDVDQFLVDELGYSSKEELYSYLAAEQIDSVALAIHQMNKGNAFIIGDMTGVGKGRQGAALIRYAVKQDRVPIYFTQKSTLFTDNYRDLCDIGSRDLRPFIIASDDKEHTAYIRDAKGNVVHKLPTKKEQERVYNYIREHGTLPDEYDYVITTYSQIQNGNLDYKSTENGWESEAKKYGKGKSETATDRAGQKRRDVLAALAEGSIVILDESHTVGGDSGSGRYMQMLTSSAKGVTFMSATFAKRAENMPIYAQRTAIAEAGVKASELIDAISKGGVTLQEIMSKQLVESGQMIRRERNFDGVTIDWLSVNEETDRRQREQFNEVADIFNAIRNFQDDHITPIIDAKNEAVAEYGATVGHTKGTKDMGVKNVPFASKMYNLVNQLLFALKVDAVADRVIENLRNGFKPVISFSNTMEGFLSSAPKGVVMDDVPNFSLTLMRALDGVMRFTKKDADENSEGSSISIGELSAEGQNVYNAIRKKIMNLTADLPISPMDAIRMKIEAAGYSVAEITGRKTQLNRTDDGRYIIEDRQDKDAGKSMRDFNSGRLDVLMINKSGSTGISLHASSKFEDQRPRVMVFAQFQSDINDEVQMRGRIDRSGQVTRGRYEYIMSTIPAEQRIQMMFKAKLKSLDANTTSSQKSKFNEMEIVDYLNKYGDEVVWEYMKEHPELEERLGDPLEILQGNNTEGGPRTFKKKENTSKKSDCAGTISRYLAFLSVEEQDEIFREITEAYRVKIQLLDDAGENDLEITTMPLRADTKRKQLWHEGENPGSGNAFADNTYVEEVEVDVLKKPMKRAEIEEATRKLMGEYYTEKNGGVDWQHYVRAKGDEISLFFQAKADEALGKLKEAGEARIAKAREKAVAAAAKARGRGENNFTDEEIQSLADIAANEERAKEEQKQNKRFEEIMAVKDRIKSLMTQFRAGAIYVVPQDLKQATPEMFSQTFGTFIGFKFNKSFALGSSTAIFATLDGRRKVELALSDPGLQTISGATNIVYRYSPKEINAISMENWDSKVPTKTRQKRYIITGNLLQALVDTGKGEKTRGNLISYSTIDGEIRQGILMGENFKLTDLRNSASLSSRIADIRDGQVVVSENGDVQISKEMYDWRHRGQYELRVPKSKQRGGIYTTNADLLKLVENHNFITKGNNMVGYVTEGDISKVVNMLSRAPFNITVLQESNLSDVSVSEADNSEDAANEPGVSYSDKNINFANKYETEEGKTINYTSENPEGYGGLFDFSEEEGESLLRKDRGGENAGSAAVYDGAGAVNLQREGDKALTSSHINRLNRKAGEYCNVERVFTESGSFQFTSGERIESADDVAFIFSALEDAAVEHTFAVYVKDGIPTVIELGMGTFTSSLANLGPAYLAYTRIKPDEIYFVHNHPSGNLKCSPQDVQMLRKFEEMSDVPVYGVIINLKTGKYGTFDTASNSSVGEKRRPEVEYPLTVHKLDKQIFAPEYDPMSQPFVWSSEDVAKFLNSHRMGDRAKLSFLIISQSGGIIGNIHTPYKQIASSNFEKIAQYISERVLQFGGMSAIVYGDFSGKNNRDAIRELKERLKQLGDVNLRDVIRIEGNHTMSANDEGMLFEPGSEYGASPEGDIHYREDGRIETRHRGNGETSPEAKRGHAERLSKKLNTPIRIVSDTNELTSDNAGMQARMRKSKGFYDPASGEIVVVLPNNATVEDVAETVFHEVVAHKGLREMIGEENYDAFCDEIYDHLKEELKQEVDAETTRRFMKDPGKGYAYHRRVAVDELFGRLAEKGFEDFTKAERSIWAKLREKVIEAINKFLGALKLPKWVKLGDNELRYILWRSHERLRTKGDYVGMARDAAKRHELGLTHNDAVRTRKQEDDVENVNRRFNEQLKRQIDGTLPTGHIYQLGKPGKVLHSTGVPNLPIQMSATRLREKATEYGHDFELAEIRNLVKELQTPMAVFAYGDKGKMQNIIVGIESNGKQFIVGLSLNPIVNGKALEINSVRNIFPKDNAEWLNWISQGKLLYADKQKIQALIDKQRTILADVVYLDLDYVAKVIKKFENPTIGDDFRFRMVSHGAARQEYDERVRTKRKGSPSDKKAEKKTNRAAQIHEAYLDGMRSLRVLQEAVSHETGSRIESHEDAYEFETQMSSRNKNAEEEYKREYVKPMLDEISEICRGNEHKGKYKELVEYVIAKHGLERNAFMRSQAISNGADENQANATDYAGLTALTGEKDVADAELAATESVEEYETRVDTTKLWGKV